jgi:GNAT superfamily N-acetyltransferase
VTAPGELEIRRATPNDRAAILHLGTRTLGWLGDAEDDAFFAWKHEQNPFGRSPMWVACDGTRVAGFRTFMRWEFVERGGHVVRAVRAVDTATDPDYQGRGIFTNLTLAALEELRAEGVDTVFNTPNDKSLPGYLKMGWKVVGRLPVSVMPTRLRSFATLARGRMPASLSSVLVNAGIEPSTAFADPECVARLLGSVRVGRHLTTRRTPEFLAWRYGFRSLHYRVLPAGDGVVDGFAVFRLRRRGTAVEAVIGDVLVPRAHPERARSLARKAAATAGADYLLRIDRRAFTAEPFVRIPRVGPVLTCRPLAGWHPPALAGWNVTMGDIELF